jgi:hypothetical protein
MSPQEAYAAAVRVTPRAATPVGAGSGRSAASSNGSRNGSGSTSGF